MSKIKIGLLLSKSGPTGLWAPSAITAATLAAAEANLGGGVAEREVELIVRDGGWEPQTVVEAATRMVEEGVAAVVGMLASNSRRQVSYALSGRVPFIYTPNFEMDLPEPTIPVGTTDDLLLRPFLEWIEARFHARRFFMIGSDYRWPRKSMPMAAGMIAGMGNSVDNILLRPMNADDAWDQRAIELISRANPDVLLSFLVGDQGIPFFRAFEKAGKAACIPRCCIGTEESALLSLTQNESEAIFACANYFATSKTKANRSFMEKYWSAFDEYAPMPNAYGQSCYEGVSCAVGIARSAMQLGMPALVDVPLREVVYRSARHEGCHGRVGQKQPVFIAQAQGTSFEIEARF